MRRLLTALLILCLAVPATAGAEGGVSKLLRDACSDEHIDGTYTQAEYKKALDQLPTDSDEYTGCREVLQRGRLAALGAGKHHSTNTGGGGGTTAAAGPRAARAPPATAPRARRAPRPRRPPTRWPPPRPSSARRSPTWPSPPSRSMSAASSCSPEPWGSAQLSGAGRDVPTPLIALICLLAAAALGAGGWWLWSRVLARRFG